MILSLFYDLFIYFHGTIQTVKRSRKVPVNLLNRPQSPDDRVFNNDYNDDYNYDQDRRSVYSGRSGGGRDHSLERERGGGGYVDSGYQTRERDYDRQDRGRPAERDYSPDRQYRRDGSRGRTLDKERSPDRRYKSDHMLDRDYSPDRKYRSERMLDRDHSPDRRYRSERALDREYSPDRRYRSERMLDRAHSPDLRYGRDHSPGRDHGRDHSYERGRIPGDPRKYDEPIRRSGSRDRLDRSPSPAAIPIPLPRPARNLEPLEKPVNVLLLKNHPNEGEIGFILMQSQNVSPDVTRTERPVVYEFDTMQKVCSFPEYGLRLGSQLFIKEMTSTGLAGRDGNLQEGDIILKVPSLVLLTSNGEQIL